MDPESVSRWWGGWLPTHQLCDHVLICKMETILAAPLAHTGRSQLGICGDLSASAEGQGGTL